MKRLLLSLLVLAALSVQSASVPFQPFAASVDRVVQAMDYLGSPFSDADKQRLQALRGGNGGDEAVDAMREILDKRTLYVVNINPEMRVKVAAGDSAPVLVEAGWRQFLVRVENEAGTTAVLRASSANAESVFRSRVVRTKSDPAANRPKDFSPGAQRDRWLDVQMFDAQPLRPRLSGLEVEYRIVQLYSRDAGKREAKMSFNVGQGTQDIGFRNDADILFDCLPAREVMLKVLDENGEPTTAAFEIRDLQGRVYPSQAKRLAPDFAFHPQVYRMDGEKVKLPYGNYSVVFQRGPESIRQVKQVTVSEEQSALAFQVKRWIDPSKTGWWSGDHHIHAAGCKHYTNPSEGVHAPDMMRHCLGEDLKIGANLTWGPCFDYQKQFFTGEDDKVSQYPYLLRYDIEVSGFGSHRSGHLCLLRLRNQMYPGGESSDHWPTLCLNTLKWAKAQGALVGPAHSGWGLAIPKVELPTYLIPPFDGIGANEYIVDVTHRVPGPTGDLVPAVDFLSTVDTPYHYELNIWYHTLNVGYRTRISGETDFPCIYGERVGLGRSYVKLNGKLNYNDWCEGIRAGRNYVGDGMSHLMDFSINGQAMGEGESEVHLSKPGKVRVKLNAAALLQEEPLERIRQLRPEQKPFWHVERARIGNTRKVPVEIIVNGYPVMTKELAADGSLQELVMDVPIERSSWVAVRILPSSHTNPIFVHVGNKPIRASRRSAEWCLKGVNQCWSQKEKLIAPAEKGDAIAAYNHARKTYQALIKECFDDR